MSILLRIVPPFLIRWCNLLAGRAVGQPYSTIQKNVKKFGRFKKNIFLCIVTNIKNMNKKTTRYACLLATSRVSAILVNVFNDRIISLYSTDSYLSVKLNGIVTDDDVKKFNYCIGAVFADFQEKLVWSIESHNDKNFPLDFSKANTSLQLSIRSVTDNI